MKYFIVSDVHSFYDELMKALLAQGFEKDNQEHVLVVCGDLFDRGDQTVELLNFVKSLPDERFVYVKGNHEDLFEDCLKQLLKGGYADRHHYSNGTVKTIDALANSLPKEDLLNLPAKEVFEKTAVPLLEYIKTKCVDYFEIGDYICVHGWVPCIPRDYYGYDFECVYPKEDWNENTWKSARWINGLLAWYDGHRIEGKTIICGHYHCSFGWSHIRQKYKEFPQKTHEDFEKSFQPFIDDGIIAIDACTAYTRKVNCIVIEQ